LDEGFNTVVHVLSELHFVSTETAQVRDVEHTIVSLSVFTMGTTDLHIVFVSDGLELLLVLLELGELDVNGSAHTGTKVGRAG